MKRFFLFFVILIFSSVVFAVSDVQHSVNGNQITLTYQGTPPFWINIRPDTNIGQDGGYLWTKTNSNSFSYDMSYATNPSKIFYYGVKDNNGIWSSVNNFIIGGTECNYEAIKIETPSNKLDIGETLSSIKPVITKEDLPTLLADGTFTVINYPYTQKLEFGKTVKFTHYADSDYKDREPYLMVYTYRKTNFSTYTLQFTTPAESVNDNGILNDFKGKKIGILGKNYDIATANVSNNEVNLVLMRGDIKDVLEQGAIKSYELDKEYIVEVTYIGGTTPKVKFKINGETTELLSEGQIARLTDGTTIGVREIMEEESGEVTADKVEFYLRAEKLTCDDLDFTTISTNDNVKFNDENIDDLYCNIAARISGTKLLIDKINFIWYPDSKRFVTEAQTVTMLESFRIYYRGFTTHYIESVKIKNNEDNEIEATIPLEGGTVTLPIVSGNGAAFTKIGGADTGERLVTAAGAGATIMFDKDTDKFFAASDSNAKESHLMELVKASNTDGCTFKDIATGTKYEDKKNGTSFSVGGIILTIGRCSGDENNVSITASATGYFDRIYTKEGLTIWLPVNSSAITRNAGDHINLDGTATTYTFWMEESDKNRVLGAGKDINVTVGWTNGKAEVKNINEVKGYLGYNGNYYEIGDTDAFEGYVNSELGTRILYDTAPIQDIFELEYHGDEAYGNVYVSDMDTSFSVSENGEVEVFC